MRVSTRARARAEPSTSRGRRPTGRHQSPHAPARGRNHHRWSGFNGDKDVSTRARARAEPAISVNRRAAFISLHTRPRAGGTMAAAAACEELVRLHTRPRAGGTSRQFWNTIGPSCVSTRARARAEPACALSSLRELSDILPSWRSGELGEAGRGGGLRTSPVCSAKNREVS